jgi:hypothetical protein
MKERNQEEKKEKRFEFICECCGRKMEVWATDEDEAQRKLHIVSHRTGGYGEPEKEEYFCGEFCYSYYFREPQSESALRMAYGRKLKRCAKN